MPTARALIYPSFIPSLEALIASVAISFVAWCFNSHMPLCVVDTLTYLGRQVPPNLYHDLSTAAAFTGAATIAVLAAVMLFRLKLTRKAFSSDRTNVLTKMFRDSLITSVIALVIVVPSCVAIVMRTTQNTIGVTSVALSFVLFGLLCSEVTRYFFGSAQDSRIYRGWVLGIFLTVTAAVLLNAASVITIAHTIVTQGGVVGLGTSAELNIALRFVATAAANLAEGLFFLRVWVVMRSPWARGTIGILFSSNIALFFSLCSVYAATILGNPVRAGLLRDLNITAYYCALGTIVVVGSMLAYRLALTRKAFK
ncbi:hypothetical protein MNV49_005404 [Pseudohyphozyma bogoriensis]|nr:hypothetical protein MNV49_005404 [Pseudohyphozyma bogoriensis]